MQLTKHWTVSLDDYTIDLAWSPNGAILAAASAAGPISLFATDDGTCQHTLPGHAQGTNVLAWQPPAAALPTSAQTASHHPPPGSVLASGGQDGAVKFWDAAAGQHTASAKLGSAWVEQLAWKPVSHPAPNAPAVTPRASLPILFAAAGRTLVALHADGTRAHTFQPAPKTITALAAQPAGAVWPSLISEASCYGTPTISSSRKSFPTPMGFTPSFGRRTTIGSSRATKIRASICGVPRLKSN